MSYTWNPFEVVAPPKAAEDRPRFFRCPCCQVWVTVRIESRDLWVCPACEVGFHKSHWQAKANASAQEKVARHIEQLFNATEPPYSANSANSATKVPEYPPTTFEEMMGGIPMKLRLHIESKLGPEGLERYRNQNKTETTKGKDMIIQVALTRKPSVLEAQGGAVEKIVADWTSVIADTNNDAIARAVFANHDKIVESKVEIEKISVSVRTC